MNILTTNQAATYCAAKPQYREWTVGPLSIATCPPIYMQFIGCEQPVKRFYWPENAIVWLR